MKQAYRIEVMESADKTVYVETSTFMALCSAIARAFGIIRELRRRRQTFSEVKVLILSMEEVFVLKVDGKKATWSDPVKYSSLEHKAR